MIYIISNKTGSHREINKINNIKNKASNKCRNDISDSSRDDSDSDSLLSSYSDWVEDIRPSGRKEINILDHVVTNNIKTNKYQHNDVIYDELTFDTNSFIFLAGLRTPYQ